MGKDDVTQTAEHYILAAYSVFLFVHPVPTSVSLLHFQKILLSGGKRSNNVYIVKMTAAAR
jgi:hypothetical protein